MGPAGEELLRPDLGLRPADAAAAHPGHGCLPDQAGQHLVPSSGGSSLGFNSRPKRNESSHESGSPSRRDHCRRSYGMNRQVRTRLAFATSWSIYVAIWRNHMRGLLKSLGLLIGKAGVREVAVAD